MRKSNWAVGEAYKMNTAHDPRKRNIHDPENVYKWVDSNKLASKKLLWNSITVVGAALGALGFIVGIYCLVFLGMLL